MRNDIKAIKKNDKHTVGIIVRYIKTIELITNK